MEGDHEYRFVINGAFSPDTLPMSRLASYMADLARLFGSSEQVHFKSLEPGSTVLVQRVEPDAAEEVKDRLNALADDSASVEMIKAYRTLDQKLADDRATGSLRDGVGAEIVRFPGCDRPSRPTFGPFNTHGVLDGVLIRVGGRDKTVPVHLQDGERIHVCNATREIAKSLAAHLYGSFLRVQGEGRWERNSEGCWSMIRFNVTSFEELDDTPLSEVVAQLRRVQGSGWKSVEDPHAELQRLRCVDDEN